MLSVHERSRRGRLATVCHPCGTSSSPRTSNCICRLLSCVFVCVGAGVFACGWTRPCVWHSSRVVGAEFISSGYSSRASFAYDMGACLIKCRGVLHCQAIFYLLYGWSLGGTCSSISHNRGADRASAFGPLFRRCASSSQRAWCALPLARSVASWGVHSRTCNLWHGIPTLVRGGARDCVGPWGLACRRAAGSENNALVRLTFRVVAIGLMSPRSKSPRSSSVPCGGFCDPLGMRVRKDPARWQLK